MWLRHKNRITAIGCPAGGGDREFFNSLQRIAMERHLYPPFVELKNTFTGSAGRAIRHKKSRIIAALQPLFENGKYYIQKSHVEVKEELLTFAGGAKNDDCVDCLTYAEMILTPTAYEEEQEEYESDRVAFAGYGIDW